jgi:hypothetical protein
MSLPIAAMASLVLSIDKPMSAYLSCFGFIRADELAVHHLAEHSGHDLGEDGEDVRLEEHDRRQPRADGRAVHHGEPFHGLQLEEAVLDAGDLERLRGVHLPAVGCHRLGVGPAGDESRDVGELDQVARRGDGAN